MEGDSAVAPAERINIVYRSAVEGQIEEKELPLRLLVLGDFSNSSNGDKLASRQPVPVDKDNLDEVIAAMGLSLELEVENGLDDNQATLPLRLEINSIKDFTPDRLVLNISMLRSLVELREALTMLKGPMRNSPQFRDRLKSLLMALRKADVTGQAGKVLGGEGE